MPVTTIIRSSCRSCASCLHAKFIQKPLLWHWSIRSWKKLAAFLTLAATCHQATTSTMSTSALDPTSSQVWGNSIWPPHAVASSWTRTPKKTQIPVYKAIVTPTLLNGYETWITYRSHMNSLKRFHQNYPQESAALSRLLCQNSLRNWSTLNRVKENGTTQDKKVVNDLFKRNLNSYNID